MNIRLTLSALLISAGASFAQYAALPNICAAGFNPGKLNNDIEQSSTTGWTTVHNGTALSPQWSGIITLPFGFIFNGSAENSCKVSTSGVLTFSTSVAAVPAYTSAALPTTAVPAKSVCVWGLKGSGSNDQIRTRTFGINPNRQFWVQFNSYSSTGSSGWTYWAIVLEETSNRIYVVDQRTYNAPLALSIGVQIDSSKAIKVAGSPAIDSNTKTYALDTPDDNVYYEFIPGPQAVYDMTVTAINMPRYLELSKAPFLITGSMRNLGSDTVTSVDLNYSINGGAAVTTTLPFLSMMTGDCFNYSHATAWTPSADGAYTIRVWATAINGNNDQVISNDTSTITVAVHSITNSRVAMVEEFTQASNAPSAVQHFTFNPLIANNSTKTSNVKYHVSWPGIDPMYSFNTSQPTTRVFYYDVSALSYVLLNGKPVTGSKYTGSPDNITQAIIDTAYNEPGLFSINLAATYVGNQLSIAGSTKALLNTVTGPFTVHVALIEDPVSYANAPGTNGELVFPHVMRQMFPGANGNNIGKPINNQTDTFNYTYTIPSTLNVNGLQVVVFVQDEWNKEVLQSANTWAMVGWNEKERNTNVLHIYPNPARDQAVLNFKLEKESEVRISLFNALGEEVYAQANGNTNPGSHSMNIPLSELPSGIYSLTLRAGDSSSSSRLVVQH